MAWDVEKHSPYSMFINMVLLRNERRYVHSVAICMRFIMVQYEFIECHYSTNPSASVYSQYCSAVDEQG